MTDVTQLLTPTEAAALKEMSLNRLKYHLAKPGAPPPVVVGAGHVFYARGDIEQWRPALQPKKIKGDPKK